MKTADTIGKKRITSIDFLRGTVMIIMALDHVRMYFGYGTWYSDPTNLSTTTPLLFFTRRITHFCAPVFVFLTGTSAFLYGLNKTKTSQVAWYLFTRGIWLVFAELTIVNFAWTFDITFSFRILQVIWAIGISLILLSALIFLPVKVIFGIGVIITLGHNLLDPIQVNGTSISDLIWYVLHQPNTLFLGDTIVSLVYPVLPWLGLMALGYGFGMYYTKDYKEESRKRWFLGIGFGAVLLFLALRGFNLYGEPRPWSTQNTSIFTVMSFLNTTKYPPSLHFLLMTMSPALIFLSLSEKVQHRFITPVVVFGKAPFFFYIIHLYLIHALAMLALVFTGRDWHEYILSAEAMGSGTLSSFGLRLEAVYLV
ncbi:MAG: heparan-alpha-glucosaminide N-acetyltransferase domain-containing protein, partial [Anaerolineae bacterium]|nr:heparan-alpha-glucosaminide N-acetyltransferase domain-containing protein [Anaerolineae bacterium]